MPAMLKLDELVVKVGDETKQAAAIASASGFLVRSCGRKQPTHDGAPAPTDVKMKIPPCAASVPTEATMMYVRPASVYTAGEATKERTDQGAGPAPQLLTAQRTR